MSLRSLTKPKANRVIGIDASTNSIAFAVFENGKPDQCGEVIISGATVDERIYDAKKKTKALVKAGVLKGDYIGIEAAVHVVNIQTAISLAYVYGAIISELMVSSPQVHRIPPITWQSAIGNPNLKAFEKAQIQNDFPGKSKSWYSNKGREIRKGRTLAVAKQHFDIPGDSDNVGDAVGIALYVQQSLTRQP